MGKGLFQAQTVVMWAHIALVLASDWFSLLLTGKAAADHGVAKGLRAQPEMTGNDVTGTGSDRKWEGHVIWDGKPLTRGKGDGGLR